MLRVLNQSVMCSAASPTPKVAVHLESTNPQLLTGAKPCSLNLILTLVHAVETTG